MSGAIIDPMKAIPGPVKSGLTVKVKLVHEKAKLPEKGSKGAAGYDLYAIKNVRIAPGHRKFVPTGVILEIPDGYEGQLRGRSSLGVKHGLIISQGVGTIDSDYRGEIMVSLTNTDLDSAYMVEEGDKIAQIVFTKVAQVGLEISDALSETLRGTGGFGSTGK